MSKFRLTFFEYDEESEEWIEDKLKLYDGEYENIDDVIKTEFAQEDITEKDENYALVELTVYHHVVIEKLDTFLVCPECDSNDIQRTFKQLVSRVQKRVNGNWVTIDESQPTNSYIYWCNGCTFHSYNIQSFEHTDTHTFIKGTE